MCDSGKLTLHVEALAIFSISVANHMRIERKRIP